MENLKEKLKLSKRDYQAIDELYIQADDNKTLHFIFKDGVYNNLTLYADKARCLNWCSDNRWHLMNRVMNKATKYGYISNNFRSY